MQADVKFRPLDAILRPSRIRVPAWSSLNWFFGGNCLYFVPIRCSIRLLARTPAKVFSRFSQPLQANTGIVPELDHDHFLPNIPQFMSHVTIRRRKETARNTAQSFVFSFISKEMENMKLLIYVEKCSFMFL